MASSWWSAEICYIPLKNSSLALVGRHAVDEASPLSSLGDGSGVVPPQRCHPPGVPAGHPASSMKSMHWPEGMHGDCSSSELTFPGLVGCSHV